MLSLAGEMRVDELIEYFRDDAVMELPFAPGRMEKRYDGKEAILGFQRFLNDRRGWLRLRRWRRRFRARLALAV